MNFLDAVALCIVLSVILSEAKNPRYHSYECTNDGIDLSLVSGIPRRYASTKKLISVSLRGALSATWQSPILM